MYQGETMTLQQTTIRAIGCLCVLAGSAQAAHAQAVSTTFDELVGKLKTGSTVTVTDGAGRKVAGKVTALSAVSLQLVADGQEKTFAVPQIREVSRRQRLTGQGALIGLFAGAILGFV